MLLKLAANCLLRGTTIGLQGGLECNGAPTYAALDVRNQKHDLGYL